MMNEMTQLPTVKGSCHDIESRYAKCPIHGTMGRMTNWRPQIGLDPAVREYECVAGGSSHAFYVTKH
jgi:hypothetical protein